MSTFAIEGELSIYRALELKVPILEILGAAGDPSLDLSQVTDIDSAGLQLVLLAMREAEATGKRLRISGRSQAVTDAFGLCGIVAPAAD
jgi:anti-sigma B factor antagonist